jgi:hypothetical protein
VTDMDEFYDDPLQYIDDRIEAAIRTHMIKRGADEALAGGPVEGCTTRSDIFAICHDHAAAMSRGETLTLSVDKVRVFPYLTIGQHRSGTTGP